ncbi:unnamed protein product [Lactuca saligna]|uniref:Uncharacterized protein n=1 Tax=Lactuca saligna TaxID=75948 RepID=A0AA36E7H3_LACSI|nr:unnamed protein product [Lactuca saligna]
MRRLDSITVQAYISTRVCLGSLVAFGKLQEAPSMRVTAVRRRFMMPVSPLRANVGSSGPASPSHPAVGVISPVRSLALAPSGLPVVVQARKGGAPIRKIRILHVVPSSDEETKSHDMGLRPRKVRMVVSVDRLLGGFGEDTTAQEWSRCAHPPVTMSSLVGQLSSPMDGDLCYVAAQTSVLVVAIADRVWRIDVEHQVLYEQDCIVASEKAALEDQLATLEVLPQTPRVDLCFPFFSLCNVVAVFCTKCTVKNVLR